MTIAEMIVAIWCLGVILADIYARRIPNILTLGMCLIGIYWLLVSRHSMLNASMQSAALGATIGLVLTLPAYATRLLGAGDVKLLLAIALISGWYLTLFAFVIAALLALIVGVAYLLVNRLRAQPPIRERWLPFGAALSVGLLLAIGITK